MDNPALNKILDVLKSVAANTGAAIGLPSQNGVKPRDESKLSSNKVKTTKETAQIFSKVFTNSLGGLIADNNKNNATTFANIVGNILKPKREDNKGGFLDTILSNLGTLGKFTGILGIGMGIYYIIKSLTESGNVDWAQIGLIVGGLGLLVGFFIKFSGLFGIITNSIGMFGTFLTEFGKILKRASYVIIALGAVATLGALGYVINEQFIPMLDKFKTIGWDEIANSIGKATATVGVFGGLLWAMGELLTKTPKQFLSTGGALLLLTGGAFLLDKLISVMDNFQGARDWAKITENLWKSEAALTAFAAVMSAGGFLLTKLGPMGVIGSIAGAGVAWASIKLMNQLANSISAFETLNGSTLTEVGKGIKELGIGLAAFAFGTIGATAASLYDSLGKIFGLDPVTKLKQFEKINTAKFLNIATSFQLFSSSVIDLVDSLSKLNQLKSSLNDVKPIGIKIEAINEFNQTLVEFNKQNIEIQKNQLSELKRNNELLEVIAKGMKMGGTNVVIPSQNEDRAGNSTRIPDFSTKTNYLDLLRVTTR